MAEIPHSECSGREIPLYDVIRCICDYYHHSEQLTQSSYLP